MHDSKTRGTAILEIKESGANPRLDREQRNVSSGWVLHENETGSEVTILSFFEFAKTYFNVQLSYGTISNYLAEDGFASRLVKRKGTSFVVDVDALCQLMWNWIIIQDFRADVLKERNLHQLTSHSRATGPSDGRAIPRRVALSP